MKLLGKLPVVVLAMATVAALEACSDSCGNLYAPWRAKVVRSDRPELVGADVVVHGDVLTLDFRESGVHWTVTYVFDPDDTAAADSDSASRQ